jgi:hypothetical protein
MQSSRTRAAKLAPSRYVRVSDLVGQPEVTPTEAARNRRNGTYPQTVREARPGLLGISRATFWRLVARGAFTPIRPTTGITLFDRAEVEAWLKSQAERG